MLMVLIELQLKRDECSFLTIKIPKMCRGVDLKSEYGNSLIPDNQQDFFGGGREKPVSFWAF